jgi:EmrB/QacA subfamily drug resistance transporter
MVSVTIGIMLALLLAALDQTIVGTALPRIVSELHGLDYYAWVLTAYLVASTTMTPISGKLGDMFGRKPLLLWGMGGFLFASALCGQAQDMAQLVAARGLQGIFAGVLMANVFASIADLFPPARRARLQGIFGGVFGIASVIGPTVGGFLTDNLTWRWVFYVNIPVGIAALAFVYFAMPKTEHKATWRDIDFIGAILLTAGLVPLLVAFSITRDHDWTSPEVLGLLGFAIAVLVAFFFVERSEEHPMVPFELFKNRTFAVSVAVGFVVAVGMFGTIVYVPLIYQGVLGISATNSGALITPMMFGLVGSSILTGQLMTRIRYYRFIGTAGVALVIVGLWLLSGLTINTDPSEIVRDLVIVGIGIGSTFPLYINSVQSALPRNVVGTVTSQIQFWRNVGATVGTAILGSVLAHTLPDRIAERVSALGLPPQALSSLGSGVNAQSLFDPARTAAVPPAILAAVRSALAASLHDLFLYAAVAVVLALVLTVFLEDVPLRGREPRSAQPVAAFGD